MNKFPKSHPTEAETETIITNSEKMINDGWDYMIHEQKIHRISYMLGENIYLTNVITEKEVILIPHQIRYAEWIKAPWWYFRNSIDEHTNCLNEYCENNRLNRLIRDGINKQRKEYEHETSH